MTEKEIKDALDKVVKKILAYQPKDKENSPKVTPKNKKKP